MLRVRGARLSCALTRRNWPTSPCVPCLMGLPTASRPSPRNAGAAQLALAVGTDGRGLPGAVNRRVSGAGLRRSRCTAHYRTLFQSRRSPWHDRIPQSLGPTAWKRALRQRRLPSVPEPCDEFRHYLGIQQHNGSKTVDVGTRWRASVLWRQFADPAARIEADEHTA